MTNPAPQKPRYRAVCLDCGRMSNVYSSASSPSKWAASHRSSTDHAVKVEGEARA